MEKIIKIGDKEVKFKASALLPRIYRAATNRDLILDIQNLQESFKNKAEDPEAQFTAVDLTIFENLAWAMAYHADKENIPGTPDEWLETIDGVFSIYTILPEILELWGLNNVQTSTPAEKK